jgi:nucleoside-diphosphate-sugar epimerase
MKHIIAFSSTSAITKRESIIPAERSLAESLTRAETDIQFHCKRLGIHWAVFRPTMIYSPGKDRNVTRIAKLARTLHWFPLPGRGTGLRQPVHADDLAIACVLLAETPRDWQHIFNLSGGETLSYRQMVEVIFRNQGLPPRLICLPDWFWRIAVAIARRFPIFRDVNIAMIRRGDQDMCFDHHDAGAAFGYRARRFMP